MTDAIAPKSEGEAPKLVAEVWLPLWNRPSTKPELMTLFQRGRAEIGRRAATTSAEFSIAILDRGVDAGVTEFRRFLLLRTTGDTFESRMMNIIHLRKNG